MYPVLCLCQQACLTQKLNIVWGKGLELQSHFRLESIIWSNFIDLPLGASTLQLKQARAGSKTISESKIGTKVSMPITWSICGLDSSGSLGVWCLLVTNPNPNPNWTVTTFSGIQNYFHIVLESWVWTGLLKMVLFILGLPHGFTISYLNLVGFHEGHFVCVWMLDYFCCERCLIWPFYWYSVRYNAICMNKH